MCHHNLGTAAFFTPEILQLQISEPQIHHPLVQILRISPVASMTNVTAKGTMGFSAGLSNRAERAWRRYSRAQLKGREQPLASSNLDLNLISSWNLI